MSEAFGHRKSSARSGRREGAESDSRIRLIRTSGKLCIGLSKSFGLRKKEGVIKDFIAGEDFSISTTRCWPCWKRCPQLRGDPDLAR